MCVQLAAERIALALQPVAVDMLLPAAAEHVLHATHVRLQKTLDLSRPHHCASHRREVAGVRELVRRVLRGVRPAADQASAAASAAAHALLVVALLLRLRRTKRLVQRVDVLLDALQQLRLVLADRAADARPHEQRVEALEDAEHLVGALGARQLVAQQQRDARLDAIDTLLVSIQVEHTVHTIVQNIEDTTSLLNYKACILLSY